jgi:thioredoxin reductase
MTSDTLATWIVYAAPMLVIWGFYGWRQRSRDRSNRAALSEAREAGLTEPPSLHPFIDPNRCLGCATCVDACPEKDVLGLIGGKAQVIVAANCVGHGVCKEACPLDAITLVIGTEKRGVDVPVLDARYETNVPGIFVAGELGGMGLIRNAVEQGRQVIDSVVARGSGGGALDYDVLVVGAGPAGFSAALAAKEQGLRCLTLEQEVLGGAVAHYPRRKLVLTSPVVLPTVGRIDMRETTKEALLELWTGVESRAGLDIHYRERVDRVEREGEGFRVATPRGSYTARSVVLAIGRRGTPRKLDVPGEEQPKVVYGLVDPAQYAGLHVLVVGGGDSALEAACGLAEHPETTVTLSYRGDGFTRAKPPNREKVAAAEAAGRLQVFLRSSVTGIGRESVRICVGEDEKEIPNGAVIVCAGGILPTGFLHTIGIETETLHGAPIGAGRRGAA